MNPAEPFEVQECGGESDTQRGETPGGSSQTASRPRSMAGSKRKHEIEPRGSAPEEKKRKVGQDASKPGNNYLGTAHMRDSQAGGIPALDMLAGPHRMLGDLMEVRSLHEDQKQAQELSTLGVSAYEQFKLTGNVRELERAIKCWEEAIALLRSSQTGWWGLLSNIGCAYLSRFGRLGEVPDLGNAIKYGAEAVLLAPEGHPDKPATLNDLGVSYRTRFERLGELSDLNKAVELQTQAVLLAPDGHTDKPTYLSNLGIAYRTRFQRLGELPDLSKAVESLAQAVSLTPDGHPDKPATLSNLEVSYRTRFESLGELSDLNEAVESLAQAVLLAPDGHTDKPTYLSNLGVAYRTRFQRLGELPDLSKAVESLAQAVSLTPDGHPDKSVTLSNLEVSYRTRFERLGELPDLSKAVESLAQAVSLTPDSHIDKLGYLSNLGASYQTRFECLGELSDLNKAVESLALAALLTSKDHPDKPGYISSLGVAYRTRFERLGDLSDLNKAVELLAQVVSLTPDGDPGKPTHLSNLGVAYRTQFKRLGELSDLNKAVEFLAQSVSLTPDGCPKRPGTLGNLGVAYQIRFERLGELSDLNKAVELQTQAVSLAPDGHPDKPTYLSNLGVAYRTRFERLDELSDLNKAVELQTQAVSLTPDGHPDKPTYLSNLGVAYRTRFERLDELSDLNKAVEPLAQAVLLTPDDHPNKPRTLAELGAAYENRFIYLIDYSDLQYAESSFRRASELSTGAPSVRFLACKRWAKLCCYSAVLSPFRAYQRAMSLIPQLFWVGNTIGRHYELVAEVSDFAAEAASHAISAGAHNLALEWFEAGRSIVWGQTARLRGPFEDLALYNPKLENDLASIGRQLEHAGSRTSLPLFPMTSSPDLGQETNARVRLALEWDRLLVVIREVPGFENFLCPPRASQLLSAAKAHPIAIINLHESRCDALVLQPGSDIISHIALPELSSKDAILARRHVFSHVRGRAPGPPSDSTGSLHEPLERIWTGVTKPVLDFLGYTRKMPVDQLPQLIWCTSGLLSFIPLHAARSHDQSLPSVFDLVISSYTPTLGALLSSQSADPSSSCGIVAVGQENTPGLCSLPCTTTELAVVHKHAHSECYLQLEGDEATVAQVLDAMDQFSWVHMACHGRQDPYDPTKSAFHLHDGDLTLADITERSFTNKGLAFLSACQTATGDEKMPNEAVHLAAGLLMAGYPSVIGTMWSMADEDGPEVADLVYAELLKNGKMDHTKSARALHWAVAHLRVKVGEENFARWAPFIHIGS